MPAIHRTYTKEVYSNLKYRPTWLPGTPVELGAVGVIEDGIFRATSSLGKLGIAFHVTVDRAADGAIDFASKDGVSVTLKAAGELNSKFAAVGQMDAGALIEFSKVGAVVMQLRGVKFHRISDQIALEREILRRVAVDNSWERDWVVVTEVADAEMATIAISNSASSKLELRAKGTVKPASLADASADLSVAAESQVSTKVIAESGLTPLFRAIRARRKFWWLWDEVLPANAEAPAPDDVFADADPDDDLTSDG